MKRKSSSDDNFSSEEENGFIGLGASKKSSHDGLGFQSRMGTRTDKEDVQFASFEKYSKGIGSKLLQKMGYKKGQGLGVDGSGINVPIDVKLRPSKMGLGHGGFEELPESQQNKDSDNEEKKSWKKPFKRRKKTFQSAKELVLEIEETPLPATISHQSRIIDMTGPQVKILTDITESAKLPQASERFPELVHNLTVLSNLAKQELIHLTNKSRIQVELEKQRKKDLEESVSQLVSSQKTHSKLEKLYSILINCKAKALEKSWDLNNPDKGLQTIHEILTNDMNDLNQIPTNQNENIVFTYNVDVFYVNMITPVFKKCFLMKWKLAKDPLFGIEYIMDWKKYFMHKKDDGTMCAFENLLHTVWLPPVRSFVNNEWDALNPEHLIGMLEIYVKILPTWLYQEIVEHLLLPKLNRMLEAWNVKRGWDIHTWIFPWLPLIGQELEELWAPCRRILQQSLKKWTPTEDLGLDIVGKWSEVFDENEMKQLITNAILPKLIIYLRDEFTINPLDQDIEPLLRVFKWKTYVPSHLFSNLLETEFFNKWSNVLWIWVTSPGAQLDEITAWYQSWKKLFYSHELDTLTCSKEGFKTGLDMMNQGVSSQKPKSFIKTTSKDIGLKTKIESVQFSFKDYIQQLCAESNIEFVPTLKKSNNGLPIFKMGRNSVYIDDDVLYMLKDGDYKYIDVDDAIAQSIK